MCPRQRYPTTARRICPGIVVAEGASSRKVALLPPRRRSPSRSSRRPRRQLVFPPMLLSMILLILPLSSRRKRRRTLFMSRWRRLLLPPRPNHRWNLCRRILLTLFTSNQRKRRLSRKPCRLHWPRKILHRTRKRLRRRFLQCRTNPSRWNRAPPNILRMSSQMKPRLPRPKSHLYSPHTWLRKRRRLRPAPLRKSPLRPHQRQRRPNQSRPRM
mmetsp:Transcript_42001/g.127348  ORF Transcript_42001/g.127348 Transcript_42001/m.127348 type:complete len:214 (-) Transcript_42001:944-1585(-)